MELYVIAGGQMDSLNRWQQDLNSQFVPLYKDGKKVETGYTHQRMLVAPVQLFKICFPREELENVMSMVGLPKEKENHVLKYSVLKNSISFLRKILGLKKAPNPVAINPFLAPNPVDKSVFLIPIGIKDDQYVDGKEYI